MPTTNALPSRPTPRHDPSIVPSTSIHARRIRALAAIASVLSIAAASLAQPQLRPGSRQSDDADRSDQRAEQSTDAEPVLATLVLLDDGTVIVASRIALATHEARIADATSNRIITLDPKRVLAIFTGAPASNPSLGIGGIASAHARPLVPPGRLAVRIAAAQHPFIRSVDGIVLPATAIATPDEVPHGSTAQLALPFAANKSGDAEAIDWNFPAPGAWRMILDRIAWIWIDRIAIEWLGFTTDPITTPPTEDIIALANGDRIRGFVLELGTTIRIERADGGTVTLPIDRIAGVWLANPLEPRRGTWAFIDHGAAIPMGTPEGSSDTHWTSAAQDPPPTRPALLITHDQLVALVLQAHRLAPLSLIEPSSIIPLNPDIGDTAGTRLLSARRHPLDVALPIGPALGAMDLHIARATEVRWPLPDRAQRFIATARLPDPRNPWSSAVLIIAVDGHEAARFTLSPDQPAAAINIPAAGRALTIRVEPGPFGPVQNAVLLHRPMIIRAAD